MGITSGPCLLHHHLSHHRSNMRLPHLLKALSLAGLLFASISLTDFSPKAQASTRPALPTLPTHQEHRPVPQAPLPEFALIEDIDERKQAFFQYLLPLVHHANERLLRTRHHLEALRGQLRVRNLHIGEALWLALLAEQYRVPVEQGYDAEFFKRILRRIDVIPPSLVLAQAANESGWGTSRFAREGNNLFGEYCFTPGCGILPLERPDGRHFEVARFASPYASVQSYLTNLNRNESYLGLRKFREQFRRENRPLSGTKLAEGLGRYSERGAAYIQDIQSMIQHNELTRYDQLSETPLQRATLSGLSQQAPRH